MKIRDVCCLSKTDDCITIKKCGSGAKLTMNFVYGPIAKLLLEENRISITLSTCINTILYVFNFL